MIGTGLRYRLFLALPGPWETWPWATFLANVTGAFLLGVLLGWATDRDAGPVPRAFLGTGVLGSYTTFSAFALDATAITASGRSGIAVGYVAASVTAGLVAAWLGARLGARLGRAR